MAGPRGVVLGLLLGILQLGVGVGLLEGFERAPVALVTLLYFAYPLIASVGAALVYRERISPQRGVILAVALTGVVLMVGIPDSANVAGVILGLLAGLCVAGLILSSQYVMAKESVSPIVLCALMFSSPVLVLLLLLPCGRPTRDVRSGLGLGAVRGARRRDDPDRVLLHRRPARRVRRWQDCSRLPSRW